MNTVNFGDRNTGLQAGTINGPVAATFYATERPETPPTPTIFIPFARDKDFVRRQAIFNQIENLTLKPNSRVALVGLGGIGKSQIAIEFAYQIHEQSPSTWVFWIHASNAIRYEQSFRAIADLIKIPERQNPQKNIFQLLCDWLRSDKSGKWVIILDNVDDASFLLHSPSGHQDGQTNNPSLRVQAPLVSYLPHHQNGSILITTRSKDAARKLVELRDIIEIGPMNKNDALALIKQKLESIERYDLEMAGKLASALEYMPLAIVQATSYIAQRTPLISLRRYLEKLQQSDEERVSLLDHEGGQLRRDLEASNSIILTWQISFEHMRQFRPAAANLLSLMSFCDRQCIPEELINDIEETQARAEDTPGRIKPHGFKKLYTRLEGNRRQQQGRNKMIISSTNSTFEENVLALRDYSFISVNKDEETFVMHNLVQLSMRQWLKAQSQEERWEQEFLNRLSRQFPTGKYENWERCRIYLPHAKVAARQRPKNKKSLRDWATAMYRASWYLKEMGQGKEAETLAESAMQTRIEILGRDHEESLWAMDMVGRAYMLQARWDEAEELYTKVMETRKAKLGANHSDTLTSMNNLASTYWNQGRWDEAEKLGIEVMETFKAKLGADHPDTLTSIANLTSTYCKQGRWDEAEKLGIEVMETRKAKLGADHPDILTSINNLALIYWNQGRWDEAEKLNIKVMETCKAKLGANHLNTLASMANLAYVWHKKAAKRKRYP